MQAVDYFSRIQTGHRNALARPTDKGADRALRRMIEAANMRGDCIINSGEGYYRPDPSDEIDKALFRIYLENEKCRATSIWEKRRCMIDTFEKMRANEISIND